MKNSSNSKATPDETIISSSEIKNPHKFTLNTQREYEKIINKVKAIQISKSLPSNYLSAIQSVYRGRLVCNQENCFNMTVSENLVNRVIRILDTLVKGLEKQNFKIKYCRNDERSFVAALKDDEYISFKISEGYKYHPVKNELRSEYEKLLYRDKEPIPTGKLTLLITARESDISKSWSDGAKPLEDALPTIIDSFNTIVVKQKQQRIQNAIKAEQLQVNSKLFQEIERKKLIEKSIYDSAMAESLSFTTYQNLEAYLSYIESEYIRKFGSLNQSAYNWISTARKIAELQNPVFKRLSQLKNQNVDT